MVKVTIRRLFLVVAFLAAASQTVTAALTTTDPLLTLAVANGTALVNNKVSNETDKMTEIGLLQNSIGIQFNAIKTWEDKYNSYLKTANGYAEALKAGTTLYTDAMVTIRTIRDIIRAVEKNPEGLAANLVMSDIYLETATEFVKTFRMLRYAVAEGGEYNMLTGKERTMMMWALCDRMEELNRKLNVLCMSLWYYRLEDVWNYATRGLLDRDMSDMADESFRRWKRGGWSTPANTPSRITRPCCP